MTCPSLALDSTASGRRARHRRSFLLGALVALGATPALADAPAPSAVAAQEPLVAVRAAHLFDGKNARLLGPVTVFVRGARIESVAPNAPVPEGMRVVELGPLTLMPGLIDAHAHLLANEDGDYKQMLVTKSQAFRALEGASHAHKTLLAGYTTVRDCENEGSGYADVALRDAIQKGLLPGPRLLVATRAIAAVGGYFPFGVSPDLQGFPTGAQMISGAEEARRAAREQIRNGADLLKLYADFALPAGGTGSRGAAPTLTVEEMAAAVDVAHRARRKVAAHANTVPGIRNALAAGVDSIEHGTSADRETLLLMKQKGVFLVPTTAIILESLAELPRPLPPEAQRFDDGVHRVVPLARDLGVKIAAGYDASLGAKQGHNAREPISLVQLGLPPAQALRAATSTAAELLGLADQVGTIEAQKAADLVAVEGNPLEDIHALERVRFVMKAGEVVKAPAP